VKRDGVRARRDFWTDEQEQGRTLGVAYDYPRRPNESALMYAERIAILAGLMPASRAAFHENSKLEPVPQNFPREELV
jgi:hypothetical protein